MWPAVPPMHASHGRAGTAPSFVLWLASSNGVLWWCIGARACMQWVILKTGLANAQASAIVSASRTLVVPSKTNLLPVWRAAVDLEVAVQCVLAFAFAIAFLLELTHPFPAGDWRICVAVPEAAWLG